MRFIKKILAACLGTAMCFGFVNFNVHAEEPKKIPSISLTITSNVEYGAAVNADDVAVEPRGSKYYVAEKEFLNGVETWGTGDTPRMRIILQAEENNYFALEEKGGVKLFGDCNVTSLISKTTLDTNDKLALEINLPPISQTLGSINMVRWTSPGYANWNSVFGADHYEVRTYKDGTLTGGTQEVNAVYCDVSSNMKSEGKYAFEVRAVSRIDSSKKTEWLKSEEIVMTKAASDRFKYGGTPIGWIYNGSGWKYRMQGGGYAKDGWQSIDQEWYYFDDSAVMKTGWIAVSGKWYYLDENGKMLSDAVTPDGFYVDTSGVYVPDSTSNENSVSE